MMACLQTLWDARLAAAVQEEAEDPLPALVPLEGAPTDMDAEDGFRVRSEDQLIEAGFASWRLTVEPSGVRLLEGPDEPQRVRIVDEGLDFA